RVVLRRLCSPLFCRAGCSRSFSLFFFYCCGVRRDLHSFPTRRSSDLRTSSCSAALSGACVGRSLGAWSGVVSEDSGDWTAQAEVDRKSTRLNSSHVSISYAVFCLKKKKRRTETVVSNSPNHKNKDTRN